MRNHNGSASRKLGHLILIEGDAEEGEDVGDDENNKADQITD